MSYIFMDVGLLLFFAKLIFFEVNHELVFKSTFTFLTLNILDIVEETKWSNNKRVKKRPKHFLHIPVELE